MIHDTGLFNRNPSSWNCFCGAHDLALCVCVCAFYNKISILRLSKLTLSIDLTKLHWFQRTTCKRWLKSHWTFKQGSVNNFICLIHTMMLLYLYFHSYVFVMHVCVCLYWANRRQTCLKLFYFTFSFQSIAHILLCMLLFYNVST